MASVYALATWRCSLKEGIKQLEAGRVLGSHAPRPRICPPKPSCRTVQPNEGGFYLQ